MKNNFINRFFGPDAAAGGAGLDPVSLALAGLQGGLGIIQSISGDAKAKRLMAQRTAYKTPDEIWKILNASLSMAGGDTITRDFQTNQIDRGFSQALGTATRLGADPNDLSALFDQKMQGILKVGQQFHASNMEAFGKVLSAYNLVADNKAAEWSSGQDIIKDKLQAASAEKAAGIQNIGSAANAAIGISAAAKTSNLYTLQLEKMLKDAGITLPGTTTTETEYKPIYR